LSIITDNIELESFPYPGCYYL